MPVSSMLPSHRFLGDVLIRSSLPDADRSWTPLATAPGCYHSPAHQAATPMFSAKDEQAIICFECNYHFQIFSAPSLYAVAGDPTSCDVLIMSRRPA